MSQRDIGSGVPEEYTRDVASSAPPHEYSAEYRAFLYDYFSIPSDFVERHAKETPEIFAANIDGLFLSVRKRQKNAQPEQAKKLARYIFQVQRLLIADHKKLNPNAYETENR